jgi:metallophosphoesterase (TIGR03768 family)
MTNSHSKKPSDVLSGDELKMVHTVSRREFLQYSVGIASGICLNALVPKYVRAAVSKQPTYPIDPNVLTTVYRTLLFQSKSGLANYELQDISQYATYGYGSYTFGEGIASRQRTDVMPDGYSNPSPVRLKQFSSFFSISDIHITDKEAPNQLIYMQQTDPVFFSMGSIYSPVMLYTTHVLDAAIQSINVLHEQTPFDFGISLGDACNTSQYNEIRWYIDVIDGKRITPSSGEHAGSTFIDYQMPFKAAGLNKKIPWYQTLGNHDHFWIGTFPPDADSLGLVDSYTTDEVMACGMLKYTPDDFPCMFDIPASFLQEKPTYYMGLLDGATPDGKIICAGSYSAPPTVPADPDRRRVTIAEWKKQFFNTTTKPVGHGFNLVHKSLGPDFACYSFKPKSKIPLKVIVLDDTQSETDGSHDIHGHGFLDAKRWKWLQDELAAGQKANELMIIAAHIPIGVGAIGSDVEWWESNEEFNATEQNAVSLTELVQQLWNTPNLLMWLAGHRHVNTIKAFPSPDPSTPYQGFWQVETASLRDFPQQFRTFQIYLNDDYTVSIVTTNVDPSVVEGTPAAVSRSYAIAQQQILQGNMTPNTPNVIQYTPPGATRTFTPDTMDPTRPQGTPTELDPLTDPTIIWPTVDGYGPFPSLQAGIYGSNPESYTGHSYPSYNAELFKQLSPAMIAAMRKKFPRRS